MDNVALFYVITILIIVSYSPVMIYAVFKFLVRDRMQVQNDR